LRTADSSVAELLNYSDARHVAVCVSFNLRCAEQLLTPSTSVAALSLCASFFAAAGNYVALLGNILFPLIAFGGLFFLFRRAQGGSGGGGGPMGGMGGPMEFGRSKSKFQEVPETGVTFADVAVSALCCSVTSDCYVTNVCVWLSLCFACIWISGSCSSHAPA
jgi:hypothetical protein